MKTQLYGAKSGFTLVELMVVIAIFGSFVLATNIFNYSPQTESEKADRMMVAISGRLRTELQNMSMWRMPNRDGKIARTIQIDIGTGWMITRYLTGVTSWVNISTGVFLAPFYDKDAEYKIVSVIWTGSSTPSDWQQWTGIVMILPTWIIFTWGTNPTTIGNNIFLEVKLWYKVRTRKVILDRRSGKIIETKLY